MCYAYVCYTYVFVYTFINVYTNLENSSQYCRKRRKNLFIILWKSTSIIE